MKFSEVISRMGMTQKTTRIMEAEALHETLDYNAILAQLIAREYFIAER
jgi:hypothetical protein